MSDPLKKGELIEHAVMGLGKVIEVEPESIHIYFLQDGRFASKLKLSVAGKLLRRAAQQSHPELDSLPLLVKEGGKYRLEQDVMTFAQAVARFREHFPEAFKDDKYRESERNYKMEAHDALGKAFGDGRGLAMIADGRISDVVEQALRIERKTNLTHPQFEKPRIADAMKDGAAASRYFGAAFRLAAAPDRANEFFPELCAAVEELPTPGGPVPRWPTTSIFLALLRPDTFLFSGRLTPKRQPSGYATSSITSRSRTGSHTNRCSTSRTCCAIGCTLWGTGFHRCPVVHLRDGTRHRIQQVTESQSLGRRESSDGSMGSKCAGKRPP